MRTFSTAILIGLTVAAVCAGAVKEARSQSNTTADIVVPKVTYCELMKHPERYHYKVVQVTAILERGFERSYLYDEADCNKGRKRPETWVTNDKSFVIDGDSEEAKTNNRVSGFGIWSLNAIGRFRRAEGPQRFGHLGCCRYEFTLMKVVDSEKISDRAH